EKFDLLINGLETNKKLLQNIHKAKLAVETIIPPESLSNPVKPKKELTIFLSFVSSLFMSIFFVFVFEYFRKYNKRMGISH
nr:hypothetical protein [Desulfobacula sp.]